GPQWLGEHFLQDHWVLAVSGTHGKTTTASMLAWILEAAGMSPGFLIGGVPGNFAVSARVGESVFFVVEADEYDTAFFDKRSKFVHYRPRTLVMNNLEFDHADIFPDLAAIQTQFHHLVRTVPAEGLIIYPEAERNLAGVLERGCWTPCETTGEGGLWSVRMVSGDGSAFHVLHDDELQGRVQWSQVGQHNIANALAAIAAARHVGVRPEQACEALCEFAGVARRMELLADIAGVRVYDDFAHHPTAIATTLAGLRKKVGDEKILAVIEPRSNTMKLGVHRESLAAATDEADQVFWYQPEGLDWSLTEVVASGSAAARVIASLDELVAKTLAEARSPCHILIMSNGGFGGFHRRLVTELNAVCEPN
ncbi:MAG TPA: UDP-N-acetylmuramate:L-alanyl-gamma-D-glutamyl-meso-diaminopimelate ligase, partial [Porticoccaceae bacterium]|nr:UDP-N-acetylmuramate:L-alanyl-gamma-D-glutamyl-meso-diaminopimelate ligase [Porticoccaceae bacterium]